MAKRNNARLRYAHFGGRWLPMHKSDVRRFEQSHSTLKGEAAIHRRTRARSRRQADFLTDRGIEF
jgi:hypothetical protein